MYPPCSFLLHFFFFFNDTATTEIYTLSLHDALPIYDPPRDRAPLPAVRLPAGGRGVQGPVDRVATEHRGARHLSARVARPVAARPRPGGPAACPHPRTPRGRPRPRPRRARLTSGPCPYPRGPRPPGQMVHATR